MRRDGKNGCISGVDWSERTSQHRLRYGKIDFATNPGEGYVSNASRNNGTIQPHQEMLEVLSVGLSHGPGVGWSERVSRYVSLSLHMMGDRIGKGPLPIWKLDDDGLPVTRN